MAARPTTRAAGDTLRQRAALHAVVGIALATLLTSLLWPLNERLPFALYYLVTLHATNQGGKWAGTLAAALSLVCVTYLVLPPAFSFDVGHERWLDTLMFAAVAGAMIIIASRLRAREWRVHRKERRIAALVQSAMDAIVLSDERGNIASFNAAAERIFGYSAEEVVGTPLARLFPPAASDAGPLRDDSGGARPHEATGRRASGETFPVEVTTSRVLDGVDGGFTILIARDVSEQRRARRELERERRFSSDLLESMPGILYLYDTDGRFMRFNKEFERASGYTADEIRRMHPLDFFQKEDHPLLSERIARVFEQGRATVEAPLLSKDGKLTPYLFTGRRALVDDTDCLVGVGIDIRDRLAAEAALARSEERYRTVLDGSFESCQLVDFGWRYLYLNPAAAVQNRRPNEELLGRNMLQAWPGIEHHEVFGMISRCMQRRAPEHAEVQFEFADGYAGWFDLRCQPAPEGVFILSIEISARIAVERERSARLEQQREANLNLERTVATRTADLRKALDHAESADRTKSAFLATMSHELRTPLNAIIGFTSLLRQGGTGPLTEEQARQLAMVEHSAHHLLALINDVLDISRIEADQLEVHAEPFDLRASIERVASLIRPLADKQRLRLEVTLDASIDGMISDRRRVEQILINLLSNAVKFTERGVVQLSVSLASSAPELGPTPDVVCIEVRDTGIGIGAADLAKIFLPFKQLDSGLGRHREGTGLGLAICQRLAAVLGGDLKVESVLGAGTTFTLRLPLFAAGETDVTSGSRVA